MGGTHSFRGGLVVVSGPSGSGKTTIVSRLAEDPRVDLAVSATTRPRRQGEVDGEDYYFLSREEFQRRIDAGEFVEYNEVFGNGNLYGTLRGPMEDRVRQAERYYLLEIDVEGGLNLKQQGYEGTYIFIEPPSIEVLRARLTGRGTESETQMAERMSKVSLEMKLRDQYDVTVVNDDLDRAFAEVQAALGLGEPATPRAGADE